MDTFSKQNIGTTLMILQQQYNHNKKLDAIYRRTITFPTNSHQKDSNLTIRKRDLKKETKNQYQKEQHLKNIKKLLESITREKTMQQRMKDQNDFFAYPALFFRQKTVRTSNLKKKKFKKDKKHTSSDHQQQQSNLASSLSVDKIKQNLPVLENYDQYDLEEWADAVNKMVIGYNIMNRDQLLSFAVKVLSVLPKKCPLEFKQAAEKLMDDICTDKVEVW